MSLGMIWSIVGLVFVVLEMISVIFFPIFFAVGAFITAIFSMFSNSWVDQVLVFSISSAILTLLGKPLLQKYFKINKQEKPSTVDALVGKTGLVTSMIEEYHIGQVKVDGAIWSALSEDGKDIEKGIKIEVVRIEGVKLIVKKHNTN